ncbi:hypothetical protein A3D71_00520 [Candidatus Kaiserbacteria bacterium RIFCSPHIGHO2_02_FULL_55_20]|uniref:Uncharacterized protein n=1 Tax=Candidatus Kaiserbacteria bacterium RIFCSPHIGHO2_02_FULL_55_20 TaxID=1798497 RepID=A0A1F6DYM5_9BACT|nr:MAG: hypothetical protein A2680_01535 [Candidatus Kaiserbacteria bacterium RIFCSPHIGHO2_01_FULL_55_37]OGG66519.1 MAG: hypothetical protein A3D71_00520 [Candidatus Kaiserbacteria bacterium RIFCSPHIGHO2_02_FULL_55_20]
MNIVIRGLNIAGWLLILGALFLTYDLTAYLGVSQLWGTLVALVGALLLLIRYFLRERRGDDV